MKNNWNADNYTDNFQFVHRYGEDVLTLLSVPENSFVVDLGCGNGALSEKLAEKYKVLGIDASEKMLEKAKVLHPDLEFMKADAVNFRLPQKADAIFSNAVFHWISNQKALVKNLSENIKSGGELVFEFGGKCCAEIVHSALKTSFEIRGKKYRNGFKFRSIGEFAPLLEKNGFVVEYATLYDRPTEQKGEDGLQNWINMFVTSAFRGINKEQSRQIINDAVELCRPDLYVNGKWYVDYVRICMKARKV